MTTAYLNRIGAAVPRHDVHDTFVAFAAGLLPSERHRALFGRMVERGQIEHRFSPLKPKALPGFTALEAEDFYIRGAFPTTGARMGVYEQEAPELVDRALDRLDLVDDEREITHLIIVSCTGFSAPGLDFHIIDRLGLDPSVERTVVGFMGCYASMNALKLARHIVRSEPESRVLIVSVELCTLHFQESADLEQILSFLVFADGCAAALVSAEPTGLSLDRFRAVLAPEEPDLISWKIRDLGFDMVLSGKVPGVLARTLTRRSGEVFGNGAPSDFDLWAVHPGGRSVLDAVETALDLPGDALANSRHVLREYGNMSSATILFVLARMLDDAATAGGRGLAMAFGPGLTAETLQFTRAH